MDETVDDPNNPAVITLYICDINTESLLDIFQKTKLLKNSLMVFFDAEAWYSLVRAESSHLEKIRRQPETFFSTPNETFLSNKESEIEFNFPEFYKSKIIAWKFHVRPEIIKASI